VTRNEYGVTSLLRRLNRWRAQHGGLKVGMRLSQESCRRLSGAVMLINIWTIDAIDWGHGVSEWAIDEAKARAPSGEELVQEVRRGSVRRGSTSPTLAVRLREIVVHHNRRLFGEAQVRVDALVVHGGAGGTSLADFYSPGTFRFDRVADGDRLPIGETGLLVYLGRPRHFLDLFIMASRDREDSDTLEKLLAALAASESAMTAQARLLAMAAGIPDPKLLSAALRAVLLLGDAAIITLRNATSGTIGLYRNSWLRGRDGWGIGQHPAEGLFTVKDLSFGFEIVEER
jgi:hypothetical protein